MKTKSKIGKQLERKQSPELVETILAAKKNKNWLKLAHILTSPRRKSLSFNLSKINEKVGEAKKIIIPGKVLSQGDFDKKVKIIALKFSGKAKERLLKSKIDFSTILEEIKSNPEMKDVQVIEK